MRIAVLSDIHANLEALTQCLGAVDQADVDAIYCVGDIVGYNADPSECVDKVRAHCDGIVMGNHDAAVACDEGLEMLPPDGRDAARYHRSQLSTGQINMLASLPMMHQVKNCTFVHATPDSPSAWKRLRSQLDAQEQFNHFDTDVCFVGHTHVPSVTASSFGVFEVRAGNRYIINVGSVGQPRDQNPKLSFGVFDTEEFTYCNKRVEYDISAAAEKIRREDRIPNRLATRLQKGA